VSTVGDAINITGYFTKYKFLYRQPLYEIGRRVGYHPGRMSAGAIIATLDRLPTIDEFETAGYSQVGAHRYHGPENVDLVRLRGLAVSSWALQGGDGLVKLIPAVPHSGTMTDDDQYPPGSGIPQWKLLFGVSIPGTIIAVMDDMTDVFGVFENRD
jgi:hypothetical protein